MSLEDLTTHRELREFAGFDLAIGSVFAGRWFKVDDAGRLRSVSLDSNIWKPGENVATCRKDEMGFTWSVVPSFSFTSTKITVAPLSVQATEARVKVEHLTPMPGCACGFYAYAEGSDDDAYKDKDRVWGVIECYGRTILGTKGLRCEKARVVGLVTDNATIRGLYPDVRFARKERRLLRHFDLIQPARRTPETDPNFWGAA